MYRLLDLYCSAGGAAMGYHRAGFEVVGVDIKPQPHFPFPFILADALEFMNGGEWLATDGRRYTWSDFDAFHASPPCQKFSTIAKYKKVTHLYPDLIAPTRDLLTATGKPWDMENVMGAPLINPFMLCGSMFGLNVRRHRLFESSYYVMTQSCNHAAQGEIQVVYGHPGGSSKRDNRKFGNVDDWALAMDINWMTAHELAEAIPPAYTQYIGAQLMRYLEAQHAK